jgi:HAD superfamily hydrolase (TIGR01484 family)
MYYNYLRMKTNYNAFVCDLDGTLAESKSPLAADMAQVLCSLMRGGKSIGVISGGWFPQFEKQFLSYMPCTELFERLYLLPTSGAVMCTYHNGAWVERYVHDISHQEYERVVKAFDEVFMHTSFPRPVATWGRQIEYRRTQITFSALGQDAPPEAKKQWGGDKTNKELKLEIVRLLTPLLPPGLQALAGGSTSVDIVRQGIDKAFGVEQFWKQTGHTKDDTLFVGDALYEGGNDYAAVRTGVDTLAVEGPQDLMHKFAKYGFI